jgi:hypothetical protein
MLRPALALTQVNAPWLAATRVRQAFSAAPRDEVNPMALKDLLVQVDGSRSGPARYEAAIRLAQDHRAHLTGLCLGVELPIPATIMGMVSPDIIESQHQAIKEEAEAAAASFQKTKGKNNQNLQLARAGLNTACG